MISPPDLSRAGGRSGAPAFAIAHVLDATAPAVDGIDSDLQNKMMPIVQVRGHEKTADVRTNAGSSEVIQAAANVAKAPKARRRRRYYYDCPLQKSRVGHDGGGSLLTMRFVSRKPRADAVVVLENDLLTVMQALRA